MGASGDGTDAHELSSEKLLALAVEELPDAEGVAEMRRMDGMALGTSVVLGCWGVATTGGRDNVDNVLRILCCCKFVEYRSNKIGAFVNVERKKKLLTVVNLKS